MASLESPVLPTPQWHQRQRPLNVLVEGNIGSGKSTVMRRMQELDSEIEIVGERIGDWENVNGYNLLEMFYADKKRWAMSFQMCVYMSMMDAQAESYAAVDPGSRHARLMERSMYSAHKCFSRNLYLMNLMEPAQYAVLDRVMDWMEKECDTPPIDLIVYLKTPVNVCQERIRQRDRPAERDMTAEYLRNLEVLHDEWLLASTPTLSRWASSCPPVVTVLNAEMDRVDAVANEILALCKHCCQ